MASKIYVITGANRGIGLELTRQVLARGHKVIAGVRKSRMSLELRDLRDQSPELLKVCELDVQTDASVRQFADELKVDHVDVLINNAGVYLDDDDRVSNTKPDRVLLTLNTNSVGPFRVAQALLPLLRRASSPRIANISSQMGSIDDNASGTAPAYRMSKAALNMLTKNLAIEEKAIISICLHPGWVQTSMGGARAPLPAPASAEGLLNVIENAKSSDSGKFITYQGKELPW